MLALRCKCIDLPAGGQAQLGRSTSWKELQPAAFIKTVHALLGGVRVPHRAHIDACVFCFIIHRSSCMGVSHVCSMSLQHSANSRSHYIQNELLIPIHTWPQPYEVGVESRTVAAGLGHTCVVTIDGRMRCMHVALHCKCIDLPAGEIDELLP